MGWKGFLFLGIFILLISGVSAVWWNPFSWGDEEVSLAPSETLVLYLPFDSDANDYSSNERSGTLVDNAHLASGGINGNNALSLDGAGDYAKILLSNDELGNQVTFSVWIRPTSAQVLRAGPILTSAREINSIPRGYELFMLNEVAEMSIQTPTLNSIARGDGLAGGANYWTHVVVTYDGSIYSAQALKVYIDGTLNAVSYGSGNIIGTGQLYIGYAPTHDYDSLYLPYWEGQIDELKIYDGALSEAEVKYLYQNDPIGEEIPPSCSADTTQSCTTTDGCTGTQTCTAGVWGACTKNVASCGTPITTPTCPISPIPTPAQICSGVTICGVSGSASCTTTCPSLDASKICSGVTIYIQNSQGFICREVVGTKTGCGTCETTPNANTICAGLIYYLFNEDEDICGQIIGTGNCEETCPDEPTEADVCEGEIVPVVDDEENICRVVIGEKEDCETCGTPPEADTIPCDELEYVEDSNGGICDYVVGTQGCGGDEIIIDSCNDFGGADCDWDVISTDDELVELIYENIESWAKYNLDDGDCEAGEDEDGNSVECSCEWKGSICKEIVDKGNIGGGECETIVDENTGNCNTDTDYTITWTAGGTASGEDWCQDGSKTYRCPAKTDVPFFDLSNLIITILGIAIIYGFLIWKKK